MKSTISKITKASLWIGMIFLNAMPMMAQDDDGPPVFDEEPADLPIDDNLIYLGIVCVAFGIYAIKKQQSHQN